MVHHRVCARLVVRLCLITLATIVSLCTSQAPAKAQWTLDGAVACDAPGYQSYPYTAPDGLGGLFLAWHDQRVDYEDVYAQHVDGSGIALWGSTGLPVATGPGLQTVGGIASDGGGGCVVAWNAGDYDFQDVRAQRFDAMGTPLWGPNGQSVCADPANQQTRAVVGDGAGGAFIIWQDWRTSRGPRFYAQRVSDLGVPLWPVDGVPVGSYLADVNQAFPKVVEDGAGGFFILWSNHADVYGQRVSGDAVLLWGPTELPIAEEANAQYLVGACADGLGGVLAVWQDTRNGLPTHELYAQRLSAAGAPYWPVGGTPVSTDPAEELDWSVDGDGAGGVVVAWVDDRYGRAAYVQRLTSTGQIAWQDGDVRLGQVGYQGVRVVALPAGDAIVEWADAATSRPMAQRVRANGSRAWHSHGVPLVYTAFNLSAPQPMVTDGAGGCLAAMGGPVSGDISVGRVLWNGLSSLPLASLTARILTVADVAGDGGGYVNITVQSAPADLASSDPHVIGYSVWRRNSPIGRAPDGFLDGIWERVASFAASSQLSYVVQAPTRADSTEKGAADETYVVKVMTRSESLYTVSAIATGHSIDNSSPRSPTMKLTSDTSRTGMVVMECVSPSRAPIMIQLNAPVEKNASLLIVDMLGRAVRDLTSGLSTGMKTGVWDGRTARGEPAPPGIYFIRLRTSAGQTVRRFTLLN